MCAVRYTRICDLVATSVDEHGQPICDGCARKRQRAQQPRRHGHTAAVAHPHMCGDVFSTATNTAASCATPAASVWRPRSTTYATSRRSCMLVAHGQQADDPSNLAAVCSSCHSIKTAREQRTGSAASNQRRAVYQFLVLVQVPFVIILRWRVTVGPRFGRASGSQF